jgi:DnaJ-class molecular chaperone
MPVPIEPGTSNLLDHLKSSSQLPKGDLYIKFDILFPKAISNKHKQAIVEALRQNEEEQSQ